MQFAILAYHEEDKIKAMTPQEDAALMEALGAAHDRINQIGTLGPAARLDFVNSAVTLRGLDKVIDGPFTETKEALLGLYLLDVASQEEAIAVAGELRKVNKTAVYEIRPIRHFRPGREI